MSLIIIGSDVMKFLNIRYKETLFNLDFKNTVNMIVDKSGTGKTFLISMIVDYCIENNIPYAHLDYKHRDTPLEGKEVLLFDNSDLYFNNELLNKVKSLNKFTVVVIKNTLGLDIDDMVSKYYLVNDGYSIVTRERG